MTQLASSSGTAIYKDGNMLYIVKGRGAGINTFIFLVAILVIILLGNGVLQLTVFKQQIPQSATLGLVFIGAGLAALFVLWRLWLYQKKLRSRPVSQPDYLAIIDKSNNTLLDGQNRMLAPLQQVFIARKMQLTSSSPELLLQWSGGSLTLVKGNPFSGGISAVEQVLLSNGIRKR